MIQALMPRQPVPDLTVSLAQGGQWNLHAQSPEQFTMLVFYRGLHCPVCGRYLRDLDSKLSAFEERGVNVIALSSDPQERAEQATEHWKLTQLKLGYGLSLPDARRWGLYISSGRGKTSTGIEEPEGFSEPGVFLVRPDGTLYYASVQSMPFARPNFDDLLGAVDFAVQKNYPARGEVTQL
ncbi:peroxiredoxin (plasmid) [Deinococcus peraridilitoris DSM 19664]|uniref:Peroxiredoxin n=2 Tax=Deinococcus TaxID=1298 RepID=L0A930_DEIPD|nr:peroxiredoxin [Deinococcus peraridilitoris DSM 19664]